MSEDTDKLNSILDSQIPSVDAKRQVAKSPSSFISVDKHGIRRFNGYVIPYEANRIKILDIKGHTKLRKLEDLQAGDTAVLTEAGLPVFIEGRQGRPPKLPGGMLPPASPLIGDLLKVKEGHLLNDPIMQAAESSPESSDVLNQVMLAIGEEAASLRFERMEAERKGEDTSQFSVRRIAALKALGDTWIKRKEQLSSRLIDMESPAFHALFEYITETFVRAMQGANIRSELADSVISQFAKLLDDSWKAEAKARMKE